MARNYTANKETAKKNKWIRVVDGVSVKLSKGEYFSLSWFGAVIHGCALRTGRNGPFISWPSFKGSEGAFIKRAYVYAEKGSEDEKLLDQVVQIVQHELNG